MKQNLNTYFWKVLFLQVPAFFLCEVHWYIIYSSSLPDGVAGDWKPSESDSSGGGVGSLAAGFSAGLSAVAAADSAGKFGLAALSSAAAVSGLVLVLSAAGAADFLATAGAAFLEAAASSSLSSSSSSSDEISGCFLAALAGG